ncbi:MAG TPA: putative sulfate exporter family transporter [Myxococcales bacterium]|nr:putative sulfate exporter family transporter [Myxococcales bacterium]
MSKPWIPSQKEVAGICLAVLMGLIAYGLGQLAKPHTVYVSDVIIAIFLGTLVLNTRLSQWIGLGAHTDRDTDRYERGLRFTGKWVLRLAIILMGLKIQTELFHADQAQIVVTILLFALPCAFFLTHVAAQKLGLRREMGDLLSIGSMVCGASAINALSPVIYARRRDQGLAITAVFLFSIVALVAFYPLAQALGLSDEYGGLWAGLAVNDLSSSVAVGEQFSSDASVIAAAAKSVRIMLLGPLLILFSLIRPARRGQKSKRQTPSMMSHFPKFILGYFLLFGLRVWGDSAFNDMPLWANALNANTVVVKILILSVCAGIGLQIHVDTIIELGWKAVVAGGMAALAVAGLSLVMLVGYSNGTPMNSLLAGSGALLISYLMYRSTASGEAAYRPLLKRLKDGAPLSIREAVSLLEYHDERDSLEPTTYSAILRQLYPAIGELQPLRTSPLIPPIQYRRLIYWESNNNNGSLVGVLWAPGAEAHIHSHGHDGVGKSIEGRIEMTYFEPTSDQQITVQRHEHIDPGTLIEFSSSQTIHAVRNVADRDAIDVHYYGPEDKSKGLRYDWNEQCGVGDLVVGQSIDVTISQDHLPEPRLVERGTDDD